MTGVLLLTAAAALLALGGLFAACEAAVTATGRRALLHIGRQNPRLKRTLAHMQELLQALEFGGTIAKLGAVAAATVFAERTGGAWGIPIGVPTLMGFAIVTYGVLLFAEYIPRLAVSSAPTRWAAVLIPVLPLAHALLAPLVRRWSPPELALPATQRPGEAGPDEGSGLGAPAGAYGSPAGGAAIASRERAMLHGAFRIRSAPARGIMTPLGQLVMAEAHAHVDELVALVRANWHSRVPVFEGRRENVLGMLYAKDLLPFTVGGEADVTARALMREVFFIPPAKTAEELLRDFQREHVHAAMVVDEYGAALGLVTLEDVIEEIVGEVKDEFDVEEPAWKRLEDGALLVRGDTPLAEVQRELGVEPPSGAETVESYLLKLRPQGLARGEEVHVEGLLRFRVERTAGRRIWTVRAEREEALR